MEVTAFCITLLMNVLLLVARLHLSYSQKADFPQVVPNRQQHFKDEPISVSCEGLDRLTGWRVMKKIKDSIAPCSSKWETSTGLCEITTAYPEYDSGEYWCEMGAKRSNTVNITVTDASVILESPVLPVIEGKNVTLRCIKKVTSSSFTADFYKGDLLVWSSSTGEKNIQYVSKSDEGPYKCSISRDEESPASWLTVRAAHEEPQPLQPLHLVVPLYISIAVVLVALLLLVGLRQCRKHQTIIRDTMTSPSSVQSPSSQQTEFEQAEVIQTTYAVITKPRREKGFEQASVAEPIQTTYAIITNDK